MEEKNYILFITMVGFCLLWMIIHTIRLFDGVKQYQELENHGEFTIGTVERNPFDNDKKQVSFIITNDSSTRVIEPEFSMDAYWVGQKIPVIYSNHDPSISKIYSTREYKFGIRLDIIMVVISFIGLVLSIIKKEWILRQPGGMWPT